MMREAFDEFLMVVAYSTKTQLAIFLGVLFFVGILLAGDYFTSHFELHGLLSPMADVIREKIVRRYDKIAWFALCSFIALAVRYYKKDRKRLLCL